MGELGDHRNVSICRSSFGKNVLTDDDLTAVNGKRDQLEGKIQERYGLAKDQVLPYGRGRTDTAHGDLRSTSCAGARSRRPNWASHPQAHEVQDARAGQGLGTQTLPSGRRCERRPPHARVDGLGPTNVDAYPETPRQESSPEIRARNSWGKICWNSLEV